VFEALTSALATALVAAYRRARLTPADTEPSAEIEERAA